MTLMTLFVCTTSSGLLNLLMTGFVEGNGPHKFRLTYDLNFH